MGKRVGYVNFIRFRFRRNASVAVGVVPMYIYYAQTVAVVARYRGRRLRVFAVRASRSLYENRL